jgi:hypothetical protein
LAKHSVILKCWKNGGLGLGMSDFANFGTFATLSEMQWDACQVRQKAENPGKVRNFAANFGKAWKPLLNHSL